LLSTALPVMRYLWMRVPFAKLMNKLSIWGSDSFTLRVA
jgi:hypothetical protein